MVWIPARNESQNTGQLVVVLLEVDGTTHISRELAALLAGNQPGFEVDPDLPAHPVLVLLSILRCISF